MNPIRRALMVVAKQPVPGQTKTRLTPPLTAERSAALYECFLRDTLDTIRLAQQIAAPEIVFDPIIAYAPENGQSYFQDLAPDFGLLLQQGADLSERLNHATSYCLTIGGYQQAVIMDSDSPTLPADCLRQAFAALDGETDVSLGPCDDGGYYLIGLKQPTPDLFLTVTMSTSQVVADTLARARETNLNIAMLPISYDIDYVTDLQRLIQDLGTLPDTIGRHTRRFLAAHSLLDGNGS